MRFREQLEDLEQELRGNCHHSVLAGRNTGIPSIDKMNGDWSTSDFSYLVGGIIAAYLNCSDDMRAELDFIAADTAR